MAKKKVRDAAWFTMRAGKRDANHGDVRDGIRRGGYDVTDTAPLPRKADLLVHIGSDRWHWFEVKTPENRSNLTPDEVKFRDWCARVGARWAVICSAAEGLELLTRAGGKGLAPTELKKPKRKLPTMEQALAASPKPVVFNDALFRDLNNVMRDAARVGIQRATDRERRFGETSEQHMRRLATSGTVRRR